MAAMLMSSLDTKNGFRPWGPFSVSLKYPSSIVLDPPMPEPMMTPARFLSKGNESSPASLTAIVDAAIPNCEKRSMRSADFLSIQFSA